MEDDKINDANCVAGEIPSGEDAEMNTIYESDPDYKLETMSPIHFDHNSIDENPAVVGIESEENVNRYVMFASDEVANEATDNESNECVNAISTNTLHNQRIKSVEERFDIIKDLELTQRLAQYQRLDMSCNLCASTLQSLFEAKAHYKTEHNDSHGYIKCCGIRLNEKSEMVDHIEWHRNPNVFKCQHCTKLCDRKSQLTQHMLTHEPMITIRYMCTKCDKNFSREHLLNEHFSAEHTESGNFECDICKKRYDTDRWFKINHELIDFQFQIQNIHFNKRAYLFQTRA